MEAKQIEKAVNLVSSVAQAVEMAKFENVRWQKVRRLHLWDDVKTSTDRSQRITCNTKVPLDE